MWLIYFLFILALVLLEIIKRQMLVSKNFNIKPLNFSAIVKEKDEVQKKVLDLVVEGDSIEA